MTKIHDMIIVGDGILGLLTAFHLLLKNSNLKISIISPQLKNAASTSAGAMISCFGELTETSFSTHAKKQKFDMAFKALKKWPKLIEKINQFSSKKLKIKNGTHILLNAKSGTLDTENFFSITQALDDYKEPYQEISPKSVPGLNPIGSCRPLRAIYLPNEGYINSIQVINTLRDILSSFYKVTFIDSFVTEVNYKGGVVHGVTLKSGEKLFSPKVLLAAGAYTQNIIDKIPEIRTNIPALFSGVGLSLLIKTQDHSVESVLRTPNRAGACGLHIVPRDHNTLYIGATNNVDLLPSRSVNFGLTQFLIQCTIEQINQDFYHAHIDDWIVGNRPASLDTFPLIGKTSIKGLYILTGTYRDGFLLSPHLSEYMADLMFGDFMPQKNDLFTPERPFIQTTNIEDSVEEFLSHYIAGGYEHSMALPPFLSEKDFLTPLRQKIQNLYEYLEIDFGLSPDILLMVILAKDPNTVLKTLKKNLKNLSIPTQHENVEILRQKMVL